MSQPAAPVPAPGNAAAWLGLTLTPGLGLRGIHKLLQRIGGVEAIYAASLTALEGAEILPAAARHIHAGRSLELGAREAEQAQLQGVAVLPLDHRDYPPQLREIYDPPPVLYVRGDVAALAAYAIALVGTRRPTVYGRLMAAKFGAELAAWRLCVASGLARGIDSLGQAACVDAGGRSIAVLGSGVDVIYPRENAKLADHLIAAGGALISEFPLGAIPAAQNFPIRNRVISGISLGVLVIEGGEFSGSRITSRLALEHDREVFAVPGMATQAQAWLPNTLIKQGAKLVTEVADIVMELPSDVRARLQAPPVANPPSGEKEPETGLAASILSVLRVEEPTHVDEIADRLENSLSAPQLLTALFDLELAGKVRQLPGKTYLRVS